MLSFRDVKLLEIKRVMLALATESSDASAEAYGLLHEYLAVVLCAKDVTAPAAPKESVRVPRRTAAPEPEGNLPGAGSETAPPPQPPEFKTWLDGVIKGNDGLAPETA